MFFFLIKRLPFKKLKKKSLDFEAIKPTSGIDLKITRQKCPFIYE